MNDQLIPVPFYEDTMVLVDHEGVPCVAMKPIVENMGLAWQGQHAKLTAKFGAVITIIVTTGVDGKQYEMICLPLRKLPAWLYSINRSKVKPELREKIARYQDECDDALWDYWTKGSATRPGARPPTISQQLSAHGIRLRLLDKIEAETHPQKRLAIQAQLDHASRLLGIPTPVFGTIGRDAEPDHESPLLEEFWDVFESLQALWGGKLNHARGGKMIAISLPQFRQVASESGMHLPEIAELRRVLRASMSPRFIAVKAVNSAWTNRTTKCWVFDAEADLFMDAS